MADMFRRTELDFGGATTADRGLLVPNKGLTGILMQNLNLTYAQNITRIYEIGRSGRKTSVYYVGGRAQGNMGAAHVIGPRVTMKQFYDNFSDVCQARTNDIKISLSSPFCDNGGPVGGFRPGYLAKFCVLTQVGLSVAAQDFVINENSQLMFSNLEYFEGPVDVGKEPLPEF